MSDGQLERDPWVIGWQVSGAGYAGRKLIQVRLVNKETGESFMFPEKPL